jgi:predicted metal-dependent hydrolase
MTDLQVRKMRFGFADHPVPFLWNTLDPAFSCAANALSFMFVAVEKMISTTVHEAMPMITDPEVADEAVAFVRQEGQHSMAHRQHVKALVDGHPGLQETFDQVLALYDDLTADRSMTYRLAYIADLEATFAPAFTMMLDNADTLFAPGDDRVASLFLWHIVEEMEHRSSALTIYDDVVGEPWYRMRVAPSVFRHAGAVLTKATRGFNKHIPLDEREVDATSMLRPPSLKELLAHRFPSIRQLRRFAATAYGPIQRPYPHVPRRQQAAAAYGIVRSQIPGHHPARHKLPALAVEWQARYHAGYDVTRWYTAAAHHASLS